MTRWHKPLERETPLDAFERRMTARIYTVGAIIIVVSAVMMWTHW